MRSFALGRQKFGLVIVPYGAFAAPPIDRIRGADRDTGRPIEAVVGSASIDHLNQVRCELWRYRAFAADGTVAEEEILELAIRWTFRWEMRHLLRLAGFSIEAEFSDFLGSPPAYGKEQIWIAHKSPKYNRLFATHGCVQLRRFS